MFGFARARTSELTTQEYCRLKSHYCGLCHSLRKEFGLPAAALTGWDGRFLSLLVEAQTAEIKHPDETRCPATLGIHKKVITADGTATRFAAAATVFLVGEKLKDDMRDDHSKLSVVATGLLGRQIRQATDTLRMFGFPLDEIEGLRVEQHKVESNLRGLDLMTATAPAAEAVGLLFAHTAVLANVAENYDALTQIGRCVGRVVAILDACRDYLDDIKRNRFNTVAAMLTKSEPVIPVRLHRYHELDSFLRWQLAEIRTELGNLVLYQHVRIVQNILIMGLYDITTNVCTQFASNFCQQESLPCPQPILCPNCGHKMVEYFCTHCGASRYQHQVD